MRKRKGSITRIVRVTGEDCLTVGGMNATRELTASIIGEKNIPSSDYKVTYAISSKGNVKCYISEEGGTPRIINIKTKRSRCVCWLPKYFNDHKLLRTVEIIKKRKK